MLTSLPYPRKIDMGANIGCLGIVGQDPIQDLQLRMPFRRMDPKEGPHGASDGFAIKELELDKIII